MSDRPKYVQLREFIFNYIQENKLSEGHRIFSELELAKKFSLSRHTVRQAIDDLVNDGILYRSQGKGTYVSSPLESKTASNHLIGVVTTYIGDYIFPSIIRGMDHVLSTKSYSMILSHTDNKVEKEEKSLMNLLSQNLSGLIVEPTKSALPNPNLLLYKNILEQQLPVVFINSNYTGIDIPSVQQDDEKGGFLAASHLFESGHKNVSGIFKVDDIQGHRRYSGFVNAHKKYGLPICEETVLWYTTEDVEYKFSSVHLGTFLKRIRHCTGLVCYNDQISIEVIEVLRNKKMRVPEDISLVSFDNSELSGATEVKLTTVAHPREKLGEMAAQTLLERIESGRNVSSILMKPELILRSSTRKV